MIVPASTQGTVTAQAEDDTALISDPVLVTVSTGPVIAAFTAQVTGGTNVLLSGTVTDDHPASCVVYFNGVVTGSATADAAGNFSLVASATAVGTITALAIDGDQLFSNQAQAIVTNNLPSLTLSVSPQGAGGAITLSGRVTDESPAGLTVTFGGAAADSAVTDAGGNFSLTTTRWRPGTVTAQTTDVWGQASNAATAVLTNAAPVISNFTVIPTSGGFWTFRGQVTDESAPGLTVWLSGLPSLNGSAGHTAVTVGASGWFEFTVQLTAQDHGCVTAQAFDWQYTASPLATCDV
jgi:hypothetical protein